MVTIKHKFLEWKIDPSTETLVVGTFNPETAENDFFYGSGHNFLWKLLPFAFGEESLKGKTKEEKIAFIRARRIDFIDVISAVDIDHGQETNRADKYIDGRVLQWRDVVAELEKLHSLKQIYFTRKKSTEVKGISQQFGLIESYLATRNISCVFIATPARFWNEQKQLKWNDALGAARRAQ
jgi:G:T/U-mismatch repair DNA glycosylase